MEIVIWTDRVDRGGHIIKTANIDTKDFEKNPVVVHLHNDYSLPIGMLSNLKKSGGQLTAEITWDKEDPRAQEIAGKYERGFMKAFSPRFRAKNPQDDEQNKTREYGYAELVEVSTVTIGQHPDAVVLKKKFNAKDDEEIITEVVEQPLKQKSKSEMEELFKTLGLASDATEVKAVQAVHDLQKKYDKSQTDLQKALDDKKKADDEVADLRKELVAAQEASTEKEIDTLVDGAVKDKKILPAQAAEYKELAKVEGGFERVKKILDGISPAKSIDQQLGAGSADLQKKLDDRADWTYMRWAKEDSAGLTELRDKNPQAFKELQKKLK